MVGWVATRTKLPSDVVERDKCAVVVCLQIQHGLLVILWIPTWSMGSNLLLTVLRSGWTTVSGLNYGGPKIETIWRTKGWSLVGQFPLISYCEHLTQFTGAVKCRSISPSTQIFISFRDYNYGSLSNDLKHKRW